MKICPHCGTEHLYADEDGIYRCFKCSYWNDPEFPLRQGREEDDTSIEESEVKRLKVDCEQMNMDAKKYGKHKGKYDWAKPEDVNRYRRDYVNANRERIREIKRKWNMKHKAAQKQAALAVA